MIRITYIFTYLFSLLLISSTILNAKSEIMRGKASLNLLVEGNIQIDMTAYKYSDSVLLRSPILEFSPSQASCINMQINELKKLLSKDPIRLFFLSRSWEKLTFNFSDWTDNSNFSNLEHHSRFHITEFEPMDTTITIDLNLSKRGCDFILAEEFEKVIITAQYEVNQRSEAYKSQLSALKEIAKQLQK